MTKEIHSYKMKPITPTYTVIPLDNRIKEFFENRYDNHYFLRNDLTITYFNTYNPHIKITLLKKDNKYFEYEIYLNENLYLIYDNNYPVLDPDFKIIITSSLHNYKKTKEKH